MARRWLAAAVLAAIIVRTHAGTDGAMDVFFEQQLESVNLDQLKDGKPIGVDIAQYLQLKTIGERGRLSAFRVDRIAKPLDRSVYRKSCRLWSRSAQALCATSSARSQRVCCGQRAQRSWSRASTWSSRSSA